MGKQARVSTSLDPDIRDAISLHFPYDKDQAFTVECLIEELKLHTKNGPLFTTLAAIDFVKRCWEAPRAVYGAYPSLLDFNESANQEYLRAKKKLDSIHLPKPVERHTRSYIDWVS
jgi:hypothetical protein